MVKWIYDFRVLTLLNLCIFFDWFILFIKGKFFQDLFRISILSSFLTNQAQNWILLSFRGFTYSKTLMFDLTFHFLLILNIYILEFIIQWSFYLILLIRLFLWKILAIEFWIILLISNHIQRILSKNVILKASIFFYLKFFLLLKVLRSSKFKIIHFYSIFIRIYYIT